MFTGLVEELGTIREIVPNATGAHITLIPRTQEVTTLGFREVGSQVNLEVDILAKYVERLLNPD